MVDKRIGKKSTADTVTPRAKVSPPSAAVAPAAAIVDSRNILPVGAIRKSKAAAIEAPPWTAKTTRKRAASTLSMESTNAPILPAAKKRKGQDTDIAPQGTLAKGPVRIDLKSFSKPPPRAPRVPRAPKINVDVESSDTNDASREPGPSPPTATSSDTALAERQHQAGSSGRVPVINEDDSKDVGKGSDGLSGTDEDDNSKEDEEIEEKDDGVSGIDFDHETVHFHVPSSQSKAYDGHPSLRLTPPSEARTDSPKQRKSSRSPSIPTEPPASDADDNEDNESELDSQTSLPPRLQKRPRVAALASSDDEDLRAPVSKPKPKVQRAKPSRRELKLKAEMPTIQTKLTGKEPKEETADSEPLWNTRTNITTYLRGKLHKIHIGPQSHIIKQLLRDAIELSRFYVAFGVPDDEKLRGDKIIKKLSPVSPGGSERLCSLALVATAEEQGFEGQFDIAHRLEKGNAKEYLDPLRDHVVQRIVLYRGEMKKAVSNLVINHLGAAANNKLELARILDEKSYIYPITNGVRNTNKLFGSELVPLAVEAAFFGRGNIASRYPASFTSSLHDKPHEYEVPRSMVASAMTSCHSIICQLQIGRDLGGKVLDGTYKAHILFLTNFQTAQPLEYHKLMHKIFKKANGSMGLPHGEAQSTMKVLESVNWDAIEVSD